MRRGAYVQARRRPIVLAIDWKILIPSPVDCLRKAGWFGGARPPPSLPFPNNCLASCRMHHKADILQKFHLTSPQTMVYCLAQRSKQGAEVRCQPPESRNNSAWAVEATRDHS